ncbi:hypothetical protein CHUAL_000115 [Chamberlinius hualienensis]
MDLYDWFKKISVGAKWDRKQVVKAFPHLNKEPEPIPTYSKQEIKLSDEVGTKKSKKRKKKSEISSENKVKKLKNDGEDEEDEDGSEDEIYLTSNIKAVSRKKLKKKKKNEMGKFSVEKLNELKREQVRFITS